MERRDPSSLRVLTLNLWGRRGDWPARRSVLVRGLRDLRPDVVAFQEAIVTDGYDQVRDLLGPAFHIAHQTHREPDGQGISIASRWRIGALHEVDLHVTPRTRDFACGTLVSEIDAPDPLGRLVFANHKPSWQSAYEAERALQAVAAARFIEELVQRDRRHVVLAGALDADPASGSVRFWCGRQALEGASVCYRDAWESARDGDRGDTFSPSNELMADHDWPFRRIDYIFVRCGDHGGPTLQVPSCKVVFEQPVAGVWASDHFGVVADLALPATGS